MTVNLCRLSNVLTRMETNLIFQSTHAEDLVVFTIKVGFVDGVMKEG